MISQAASAVSWARNSIVCIYYEEKVEISPFPYAKAIANVTTAKHNISRC